MAYENVRSKFEAMGAWAVVSVDDQTRNGRCGLGRDIDYTIDANEAHKHGEMFEAHVSPEAAGDVDLTVPNIDKQAHQMLLVDRHRGLCASI